MKAASWHLGGQYCAATAGPPAPSPATDTDVGRTSSPPEKAPVNPRPSSGPRRARVHRPASLRASAAALLAVALLVPGTSAGAEDTLGVSSSDAVVLAGAAAPEGPTSPAAEPVDPATAAAPSTPASGPAAKADPGVETDPAGGTGPAPATDPAPAADPAPETDPAASPGPAADRPVSPPPATEVAGDEATGTASLSGRVVDDSGAPLAGVQVYVGDADPGDQVPETAADGTWRMEGLPAGDYEVAFVLLGDTQPYVLHWDGTTYGSWWPPYAPLTLHEGEARGGIDVTFVDNTADGVVRAGGEPVEGALVELYRSLTDDEPVQTVETAADGSWTARWLRPGSYTVRVVPPAGSGLAPTWWQRSGSSYGNLYYPADAPASARTGVDVDLVAGSSLTGRVVDAAGAPVVGTQVALWTRSASTWPALVGTATTGPGGTYVFDEIEAERYTVQLWPVQPSYVVGAFLGGALDIAGARWTTVGAEADVTVDDLVQREGGIVTGAIVGDGWDAVGVAVEVVDRDGSVVARELAGYDDEIDFATGALPPGAYRVRASVDGATYWWVGGNSPTTARVIDLRAGTTVSDVTIVLDAAHLEVPPAPSAEDLTESTRGPLRPVDPVLPGAEVTLAGLTPHDLVYVWLTSAPVGLGYHEVAADGTVRLTVPAGTAAGAHRLVVQYPGGFLVGWTELTVLAAPAPGVPAPPAAPAAPAGGARPVAAASAGSRSAALAVTGAELATGAGVALVGIAVGAVLLVLRRRHRLGA